MTRSVMVPDGPPPPESARRRPDFIVIGAQKSGTTSLFRQLRSHEAFALPTVKELHFFNDPEKAGDPNRVTDYLGHFAGIPADLVTGEATPDYLSNRFAPRLISELVPDARLVVLLRHPVDRAYSAFWHGRRLGHTSRRMTFEEAIERETRESGQPWTDLIATGCYATHLERYLRYFPRDQILIESFSDLTTDPTSTMARVLTFLLRDRTADERPQPVNLPHSNRGASSRAPKLSKVLLRRYRPGHPMYRVTTKTLLSYEPPPPMDARTRERLLHLYRPWNERLWELLGQSWEAWAE